jgi:hypothetical protein
VTDNSLTELRQSYMCSQLIKEILLEIKYDESVEDEFVQFCRIQHENSQKE